MHVRQVVLPLLAGAMLVGLTACGSATGAAGSAPSSSATSITNAPATSTSNQVAAAPVTTTGTPNPTPGTFSVDLTIQQDGLGLLSVRNNGRTKATIDGWPTLTFLNAANETVAVPTKKVNIPGAAASITLAPGENAFAGVKWTDGDKASESTFVATTLKVTPPGSNAALVASVIGTDGKKQGYYEFDITSVQVGTLQPSTQGVLVF
jgi:hypothetical protein